jgi:CMP-N-acetylneuraminic acid synthetase
MKVVCVCLARIGSKRLPKKLLKPFAGKELIRYTFDTMKELQKNDIDCYVYSDSQEIRDIAKEYNINDRAKLFENKEGKHHTAKELIEYNNEYNADIIILLQGTSPFRYSEIIMIGVNRIKKKFCDCIFSGHLIKNRFCYLEPDIANFNRENRDFNGSKNLKLNNLWIETGSFYIFNKKQLKKKHITCGEMLAIEDKYNIDIDTIEDFNKAEYLYKGGFYD